MLVIVHCTWVAYLFKVVIEQRCTHNARQQLHIRNISYLSKCSDISYLGKCSDTQYKNKLKQFLNCGGLKSKGAKCILFGWPISLPNIYCRTNVNVKKMEYFKVLHLEWLYLIVSHILHVYSVLSTLSTSCYICINSCLRCLICDSLFL